MIPSDIIRKGLNPAEIAAIDEVLDRAVKSDDVSLIENALLSGGYADKVLFAGANKNQDAWVDLAMAHNASPAALLYIAGCRGRQDWHDEAKKRGASREDVQKRYDSKRMLRMVCDAESDDAKVDLAIKCGADPNELLAKAIITKTPSWVDIAAAHGAVFTTPADQKPLVHKCLESFNDAVLRAVIKHGAPIDDVNDKKETALLRTLRDAAISYGDTAKCMQAAKTLAELGADPLKADGEGKFPLSELNASTRISAAQTTTLTKVFMQAIAKNKQDVAQKAADHGKPKPVRILRPLEIVNRADDQDAKPQGPSV